VQLTNSFGGVKKLHSAAVCLQKVSGTTVTSHRSRTPETNLFI